MVDVGSADGDLIGDEEVCECVDNPNGELSDLEGGQGLFEPFGDVDAECREEVEGVLR